MREKLARLRAVLEQTQNRLIEAEAELADRLLEVNRFEFEFEARVGYLLDQLEALEKEIQRYHERIEILRNKRTFGYPYVSVETQYRRAWEARPASAAPPPPEPLRPSDELQLKKLYRQLARRFHPDLAFDEADRARRNRIMAAVNEAYAARSLAELIALTQEADSPGRAQRLAGQPEAELVRILEAELARCRERLQTIEDELRGLSQRPSVRLSLEVKLARRHGRDLLAEMAAELEQKIGRRTAERDMLKTQFDQLGPEQGFIDIHP